MSDNRAETATKFAIFRYQITPIREATEDLFFNDEEIRRIISVKNKVFEKVLLKNGKFDKGAHPTIATLLYSEKDLFLFKVAIKRIIHHEKIDFSSEALANWPSILVAVWNDPGRQIIAVQDRKEAFQNPATAVTYLLNSMAHQMSLSFLTVGFKPLFEKQDFWKAVEEHKGKIKSVEFEFITPNMPGVSAALNESLKGLSKITNSKVNTVKLAAPPEKSLILDQNMPDVAGLVDYSSQGGGDIKLKFEKIKRKWRSENVSKEVIIEKLEIEGSAEKAAQIIKDALNF